MVDTVIDGVSIEGVVTVVPSDIVSFEDDARRLNFNSSQANRIKNNVGLNERRVVKKGITALDLGEKACSELIKGLKNNIENIGFLIFVTQTSDHSQPCNAAILQGRLGFDSSVGTMDINLGCSGYVYGIFTAVSMAKSLDKDVLLVVGDTLSTQVNPLDSSVSILFGDAASATLVTPKNGEQMFFDMNTDGTGYESIITPAGGSRMPQTNKTSIETEDDDGNIRSLNDLKMNGSDVFNFAVRTEPAAVKKLLDYSKVLEQDIDFFFFHQANQMILSTIARRLNIKKDKVPNSIISKYGNQSSASIPCVINETLHSNEPSLVLLSGFGVGLSWASMICRLELKYCPKPIIWDQKNE
jgi:3-oxoacyl-[acyl-carrier-protein] synthase-3